MSIERLLAEPGNFEPAADLYTALHLPAPPPSRPYVIINMASTVDGKIVVGKADGPAKGVGGPTDQILFRRIQRSVDAAIIGATTLRASQVIYPAELKRFVVTRSGDLPLDNRFFVDAPDRVYAICSSTLTENARNKITTRAKVLHFGADGTDLGEALKYMRTKLGVRWLLCEGGSQINAQLLTRSLVDELFLTLSPKIKGGAHLPTIAGDPAFGEGSVLGLQLISVYHDASEVYLRYRITNCNQQSTAVQ